MGDTLNTVGSSPPVEFAAVDLGSNSFHLLVVQVHEGRVQVLDKLKDMVRLAAGLDADENLSEAAAERALQCLDRFGQRLRDVPPGNVRVVATSTLRRATNAADFIARAQAALRHSVEIISGREEARLIFLGVSRALEDQQARRLVVDIGGGSTELILGRRSHAEVMESLHVGCVGLSRRFFADGRLTATRYQNAVDHARRELEPIRLAYAAAGWDDAIGASGTIQSVQEILTRLERDPVGITLDGIEAIRRAVLDAGNAAKLALPGLSDERAPVFAGGLAILQAVFEALSIERMQVASGALREGVIQDLLGRRQQQDVRHSTVRHLMAQYHVDRRHAGRIRATALELLNQAVEPWALRDPAHALLLRWAADLHEIGMNIAHSQHHKHGDYLLRNMDMAGFSAWDQRQLAALVRAQRRKFPASESEFCGTGGKQLMRLAVLLRLAVVLHRSRGQRSLPEQTLTVDTDRIDLTLPAAWLEHHPLTRLDLQQEADYLRAVAMRLTVRGC